ncbi:hypothetical protein BZG36_04440 [Bifiguratus adelaidae]|uniref:NET domain-containing protein n=1 Tax=Bifiguratus adelaidae TaxID=1938954 RepID=A0A261XVL7_9FUNG|nr:hypothetical protein BZG36_04440 [Bifiguratus adelaidae]
METEDLDEEVEHLLRYGDLYQQDWIGTHDKGGLDTMGDGGTSLDRDIARPLKIQDLLGEDELYDGMYDEMTYDISAPLSVATPTTEQSSPETGNRVEEPLADPNAGQLESILQQLAERTRQQDTKTENEWTVRPIHHSSLQEPNGIIEPTTDSAKAAQTASSNRCPSRSQDFIVTDSPSHSSTVNTSRGFGLNGKAKKTLPKRERQPVVDTDPSASSASSSSDSSDSSSSSSSDSDSDSSSGNESSDSRKHKKQGAKRQARKSRPSTAHHEQHDTSSDEDDAKDKRQSQRGHSYSRHPNLASLPLPINRRKLEDEIIDKISNANLPQDKLEGIITIIGMADPRQEDMGSAGEIEVDLSILQIGDLQKISQYISECLQETTIDASKPKARGPRTRPGIDTASSKRSKATKRRRRKISDAETSDEDEVFYEPAQPSPSGRRKREARKRVSKAKDESAYHPTVSGHAHHTSTPNVAERPKRRAAVHKRRLLEEMLEGPSDDSDFEESIYIIQEPVPSPLPKIKLPKVIRTHVSGVESPFKAEEKIVCKYGDEEDEDDLEIDILD